jgi:hypothetical protein
VFGIISASATQIVLSSPLSNRSKGDRNRCVSFRKYSSTWADLLLLRVDSDYSWFPIRTCQWLIKWSVVLLIDPIWGRQIGFPRYLSSSLPHSDHGLKITGNQCDVLKNGQAGSLPVLAPLAEPECAKFFVPKKSRFALALAVPRQPIECLIDDPVAAPYARPI